MSVKIGITDCGKFECYEKWISKGDDEIGVIQLGERNFNDIVKCAGIILTGGEDVHPRFYGKKEYLEFCHRIDERRDEFEWRVLQYTIDKQLPLLGICRGLQITNVYFGGSLIPDIPSFRQVTHAESPERKPRIVEVDPNSELRKIVGVGSGEINCSHHQSPDRIGEGLVVNALSLDGIVEGLEREHKAGNSFLILVQWHPERMSDQDNPFSKNIKNSFLAAAKVR